MRFILAHLWRVRVKMRSPHPRDLAPNTADLADRQNIQLHWVRIEDAPEIWPRLAAVGLQTTKACGDCPRVVLCGVEAGDQSA